MCSVYSGFGLDRFSVYSGFGLDRFSVYSGFGLDRFHSVSNAFIFVVLLDCKRFNRSIFLYEALTWFTQNLLLLQKG